MARGVEGKWMIREIEPINIVTRVVVLKTVTAAPGRISMVGGSVPLVTNVRICCLFYTRIAIMSAM
jgi:hypothetical protein